MSVVVKFNGKRVKLSKKRKANKDSLLARRGAARKKVVARRRDRNHGSFSIQDLNKMSPIQIFELEEEGLV